MDALSEQVGVIRAMVSEITELLAANNVVNTDEADGIRAELGA